MSSNSDVSDVNPDELAKMIEGLDFSDDDTAKKKKGPSAGKSNLKASSKSDIGSQKKKLQFSEDTKDKDTDDLSDLLGDNSQKKVVPAATTKDDAKAKSVRELFGIEQKKVAEPPKATVKTAEEPKMGAKSPSPPTAAAAKQGRRANPVTFSDDDDDPLAALGDVSKPKPTTTNTRASSSLMDDLFGTAPKASTTSASAAVTTGKKEEVKKKEFVLDDKYKFGSTPSLSQPKAEEPPVKSSEPAGRPRRPRGTTLATLNTKPVMELDDDKLFQGTSLAPKTAVQSPPVISNLMQPNSIQQSIPQSATPIPNWLPQPQQQQQQQQQQPFVPIQVPQQQQQQGYVVQQQTMPSAYQQQVQPNPIGYQMSQLPEATQQLALSYQRQVQQMQELERQQLEQFQRDLEEQRRVLEAKQAEHRTVLEHQKNMCQEQIRSLQDRQNAIFQQQHSQAEVVMKQIQCQMEADLRTRNELLRNQLRVISDIQIQNPDQVIDMNGILEDLRLGKKVEKTEVTVERSNSRDRETLEEVESYFRQKEDRLRLAHADHVEELELRLEEASKRAKMVIQTHQEEMEEERERWKRLLKEREEEHEAVVGSVRAEHARALEGIRDVQNVQSLLTQVTANTEDLGNLQGRVEEKLGKQLDVREELLRHKDKQIQDLRDKLEERQKDHEQEMQSVRQEVKEMERMGREKEVELDSREAKLRKMAMEVEVQKGKFQLEVDVATRRMEANKKSLADEKAILQAEKKQLHRLVLEQSQEYFQERARNMIKSAASLGVDRAATDVSANFPHEIQSEIRGALTALEEERMSLDRLKQQLKADEAKLREKRRTAEEERKSILEAAAKLASAENRLNQKCEDLKDLQETCSRLAMDCRTHLDTCVRSTAERSEVRDELRLQLEEFERREIQLEEKRRELQRERKKMLNTRNSLICKSCKRQLTAAGAEEGETVAASGRGRRTAGDGQNDLVASLKKSALRDREYLDREAQYLRTLSQS